MSKFDDRSAITPKFIKDENLKLKYRLVHEAVSRMVLSGLSFITSRLLKIPVVTVSNTPKRNAQVWGLNILIVFNLGENRLSISFQI